MKLGEYVSKMADRIFDLILRYKEKETPNGIETSRMGHKVVYFYKKRLPPAEPFIRALMMIEEAERSSLINLKIGLASIHDGEYDLFRLLRKKGVGYG